MYFSSFTKVSENYDEYWDRINLPEVPFWPPTCRANGTLGVKKIDPLQSQQSKPQMDFLHYEENKRKIFYIKKKNLLCKKGRSTLLAHITMLTKYD